MDAQLLMIIVLIALDSDVIECSSAFARPDRKSWMVRFGQPMLNPVCVIDHVKTHRPRMCCVSISGLLGELDAVVHKDCVYLVWNGFQHGLSKLRGRLAICFVDQLQNGKLAGSINSYKEIQLTLIGTKLSDINLEIANRISFELLPLELIALYIWQSRNAMPF